MSRFIKNLLATTPIPMLNYVKNNDIILEGVLYIYDGYIIRCVETGRLFVSSAEKLYPSSTLYPSVVLYPGNGEASAKFMVVALYDKSDTRYNYSYHSRFGYYDSETHRHLGEYLRSLKHMESLDLMPYYNCYNYSIVENVYLKQKPLTNSKSYVIGTNDRYKVMAVPIKFFQKYTVAIDCPTEVMCRCVIYNDSGMILKDVTAPEGSTSYWSDDLESSFICYNNTSFNKPFVYSVSTEDKDMLRQQNNLYLLIQVPHTNNSSVVVLEGEYIGYEGSTRLYTVGAEISNDGNGGFEFKKDGEKSGEGHGVMSTTKKFNPQLSLLSFNCKTTFAFSDRLIEYLLWNVIHPADELYENVQRVQEAMCKIDKSVGEKYGYNSEMILNRRKFGLWDDKLSDVLLEFIEDNRSTYVLNDMDSNINKDIEYLFIRKGVNY